MKKLLSFIALAVIAVSSFAQTPAQILSRMEEEMTAHEPEGIVMTIDVKIPILGVMTSKTYALGDKSFIKASLMGKNINTWINSGCTYIYDPDENEVTIKDYSTEDDADADNAKMFDGISEGYNVTLKKETDVAWYLQCKRLKSNTDKDAPKELEVVVSKKNYWPLSLTTKAKGTTIVLRGISFGVSEEKVTFDINKYPGIKVIDKRSQK